MESLHRESRVLSFIVGRYSFNSGQEGCWRRVRARQYARGRGKQIQPPRYQAHLLWVSFNMVCLLDANDDRWP
jgi:hypothetical protein